MQKTQLAAGIAKGIIETGIEGTWGDVARSTKGDYPSIGISQWEGIRADGLLLTIPGGKRYAGESYTDLKAKGNLGKLSTLLASYEGKKAQQTELENDCLHYVQSLLKVPHFTNSECITYAGMWCPTSTKIVRLFLTNRCLDYDINNLTCLHNLFKNQYAKAAGVTRYQKGYERRAERTKQFVMNWRTKIGKR